MSESVFHFTDTGEVKTISQLTPEDIQKIHEVWAKRFTDVIESYLNRKPEQLPNIVSRLRDAGVTCEAVLTENGKAAIKLNGKFDYVKFVFGEQANGKGENQHVKK